MREKHQQKCEKDIMKSNLKEHQNNLSRAMKSLQKDKYSMVNMISVDLTLVLSKRTSKEEYTLNMKMLLLQNKKNWNAWVESKE